MTGPAQILAARAARGWTRTQLSAASGVSRGTIINMEEGRHSPGVDVLSKIAAALGITGEDLAALLAPGAWAVTEIAP